MARATIPQVQNDLVQSEAMASAPWVPGTGITLTNNTADVLDPFGGSTATKMVYDGSDVAGGFMLFQTFNAAGVVGDVNSIAVWMRLATGSVNVRLTADNAVLSGVVLSTAWVQASQVGAVSIFGAARILAVYRDAADAAARTFYLAFAQAEGGKNRLGPYAKTTGAAIPGPIRNAAIGRVPVSGRVPSNGRISP